LKEGDRPPSASPCVPAGGLWRGFALRWRPSAHVFRASRRLSQGLAAGGLEKLRRGHVIIWGSCCWHPRPPGGIFDRRAGRRPNGPIRSAPARAGEADTRFLRPRLCRGCGLSPPGVSAAARPDSDLGECRVASSRRPARGHRRGAPALSVGRGRGPPGNQRLVSAVPAPRLAGGPGPELLAGGV
jgi:hypothetical protein